MPKLYVRKFLRFTHKSRSFPQVWMWILWTKPLVKKGFAQNTQTFPQAYENFSHDMGIFPDEVLSYSFFINNVQLSN